MTENQAVTGSATTGTSAADGISATAVNTKDEKNGGGSLRRSASAGYRWLLLVFVVAGVVQVFLAGLGVFHLHSYGLDAPAGDSALDPHPARAPSSPVGSPSPVRFPSPAGFPVKNRFPARGGATGGAPHTFGRQTLTLQPVRGTS